MASKKPARNGRRSLVLLKGSPAWADWLAGLHAYVSEDLARKHGPQVKLPLAGLVESALVEYAKARGYKPKPPER